MYGPPVRQVIASPLTFRSFRRSNYHLPATRYPEEDYYTHTDTVLTHVYDEAGT